MRKKIICSIPTAALLLCLFVGPAWAEDLGRLFQQVEKLNLERNGYVLGAPLNEDQIKIALANPIEAALPDTYKFRDKHLFIVAQKASNRVLVMYEQFEDAAGSRVQDLIGDLYLAFDDPTVLAHDKVVYWAYGEKGKITSEAFEAAKKEKKPLEILATVKCISDIHIMEEKQTSATGQVYYIISSDPILMFFAGRKT